MKKILVILMMVLLCSTAVMGQTKKRNTTKKRNAKTERAMTEFEKQQKEEYLNYLLTKCEYWYKNGEIEWAEGYKKDYEETKRKNYYVKFTNHVYSDKEKAKYKKLGITLTDSREFYKDGYMVEVHFDPYGKAECMSTIVDVTDYMAKCGKRKYDSDRMERVVKELIDEINELSGYNTKATKGKNNVEGFLNAHGANVGKPKVPKKNSPSALERTKVNSEACEKHKEDAYGKYYKNAQNIKVTKKNADSNSTLCIYGVVTDESQEPLIGAVVEAVHTQSGTKYYATSNIEGRYNIQSMRAGDYTISVKYVGYSNSTYSGIYLELGNSYNLDVPMELSSRY